MTRLLHNAASGRIGNWSAAGLRSFTQNLENAHDLDRYYRRGDGTYAYLRVIRSRLLPNKSTVELLAVFSQEKPGSQQELDQLFLDSAERLGLALQCHEESASSEERGIAHIEALHCNEASWLAHSFAPYRKTEGAIADFLNHCAGIDAGDLKIEVGDAYEPLSRRYGSHQHATFPTPSAEAA